MYISYIYLHFTMFLAWLASLVSRFYAHCSADVSSVPCWCFSLVSLLYSRPNTVLCIELCIAVSNTAVQGEDGTGTSWELSPSRGELQRELLLLPLGSTKSYHIAHPSPLLLFVFFSALMLFGCFLLIKHLCLCLLISFHMVPTHIYLPKAALFEVSLCLGIVTAESY